MILKCILRWNVLNCLKWANIGIWYFQPFQISLQHIIVFRQTGMAHGDVYKRQILLGVAHAVKDEGWKLNRKVTLLFTVYEEVGHGGSFVPADTEEMISVDMGCVGADLGCTEHMLSLIHI